MGLAIVGGGCGRAAGRGAERGEKGGPDQAEKHFGFHDLPLFSEVSNFLSRRPRADQRLNRTSLTARRPSRRSICTTMSMTRSV